eukprot:Sspe_Gene.23691::Locus_9248_Transcript_1_1_Confidence_1.000_Length_2477::g.23691::m.23691
MLMLRRHFSPFMVDRIHNTFQMLDIDQDGKVGREDLITFLRCLYDLVCPSGWLPNEVLEADADAVECQEGTEGTYPVEKICSYLGKSHFRQLLADRWTPRWMNKCPQGHEMYGMKVGEGPGRTGLTKHSCTRCGRDCVASVVRCITCCLDLCPECCAAEAANTRKVGVLLLTAHQSDFEKSTFLMQMHATYGVDPASIEILSTTSHRVPRPEVRKYVSLFQPPEMDTPSSSFFHSPGQLQAFIDVVVELWYSKPGDVLDEIAENLPLEMTPDHDPNEFAFLKTVLEEMRAEVLAEAGRAPSASVGALVSLMAMHDGLGTETLLQCSGFTPLLGMGPLLAGVRGVGDIDLAKSACRKWVKCLGALVALASPDPDNTDRSLHFPTDSPPRVGQYVAWPLPIPTSPLPMAYSSYRMVWEGDGPPVVKHLSGSAILSPCIAVEVTELLSEGDVTLVVARWVESPPFPATFLQDVRDELVVAGLKLKAIPKRSCVVRFTSPGVERLVSKISRGVTQNTKAIAARARRGSSVAQEKRRRASSMSNRVSIGAAYLRSMSTSDPTPHPPSHAALHEPALELVGEEGVWRRDVEAWESEERSALHDNFLRGIQPASLPIWQAPRRTSTSDSPVSGFLETGCDPTASRLSLSDSNLLLPM